MNSIKTEVIIDETGLIKRVSDGEIIGQLAETQDFAGIDIDNALKVYSATVTSHVTTVISNCLVATITISNFRDIPNDIPFTNIVMHDELGRRIIENSIFDGSIIAVHNIMPLVQNVPEEYYSVFLTTLTIRVNELMEKLGDMIKAPILMSIDPKSQAVVPPAVLDAHGFKKVFLDKELPPELEIVRDLPVRLYIDKEIEETFINSLLAAKVTE